MTTPNRDPLDDLEVRWREDWSGDSSENVSRIRCADQLAQIRKGKILVDREDVIAHLANALYEFIDQDSPTEEQLEEVVRNKLNHLYPDPESGGTGE